MKKKVVGYMVVWSENKAFDGYTFPQGLDLDPRAPGNALEDIDAPEAGVVMFKDKKAARAAIQATHHFHRTHWPRDEDERPKMRVVPVYAFEPAQ